MTNVMQCEAPESGISHVSSFPHSESEQQPCTTELRAFSFPQYEAPEHSNQHCSSAGQSESKSQSCETGLLSPKRSSMLGIFEWAEPRFALQRNFLRPFFVLKPTFLKPRGQ